MPRKKKKPSKKNKVSPRPSRSRRSVKTKTDKPTADESAEFQFRERRLRDIPFVDRHPTPETARKYHDTLPLPFGGEVKKDAMRDHGLFH